MCVCSLVYISYILIIYNSGFYDNILYKYVMHFDHIHPSLFFRPLPVLTDPISGDILCTLEKNIPVCQQSQTGW